jgi:arylsulfatase A-like enzyme
MKSFFPFVLIIAGSAILKANNNNSPMNVILFYVDDQSWVGTSVPMDPRDFSGSRSDFFETPELARLAVEGMTFASGYSPAPMCTPSRYAIEYGQSTACLRVTQNGHINYRGGCMGIAQLLKENKPEYISVHYGKWGIEKVGDPQDIGYDYGEARGNIYGMMEDSEKRILLPPDNPKRTAICHP